MNIGAVSSYHAFPTIEYAINASQTGKASLPVSPSAAIYAHFKHVSGVPASEGVSGVNITKLKIIDTLIDQLTKLKKQPDPLTEGIEQDDKRLNALIDKYQTQIRQTVTGGSPYAPAASPLVGAIFNISV